MTSVVVAVDDVPDPHELSVPSVPLEQWVEALSDWPELDESLFDFAKAVVTIGDGPNSWDELSTWLVARRACDWIGGERTRALVFRPDWRERVIDTAGLPSAGQDIRPLLISHWLAHPNLRYTEPIAELARRIEAWELMARIWLLNRRISGRRGQTKTASAFRMAPDAARKRCPILSWAMALAEAEASARSPERTLMRSLIRDAVRLHSDWAANEDLDSAVIGGTMWMVAQRLLPSSSPGAALEDAWRTRAAIAARIAEAPHRGPGPSAMARTVFATFSAQIALARGELVAAVAEARIAQIVGGAGSGLAWFARGIEAFSGCLMGAPLKPAQIPAHAPRRVIAGECSFRQAGITLLHLADGVLALERLDHPGLVAALDAITPSSAMGASTWASLAFLQSLHEALWGTPAAALEVVDELSARFSGALAEQDEPLGRFMLGRARVIVLSLLGATDAAAAAVDELPEIGRWPSASLASLWQGDLSGTIRAADSGLFDKDTWASSRVYLAATRAAALAMDAATPADVRADVARATVVRGVTEQRQLSLAILPISARTALFSAFEASAGSRGLTALAELNKLLASMTQVDERNHTRVTLTKRERVLLPLLASADSVPDIARSLHLSPNTVRKQVVTLRAKFNASNRAQLIRNAREAGFLA